MCVCVCVLLDLTGALPKAQKCIFPLDKFLQRTLLSAMTARTSPCETQRQEESDLTVKMRAWRKSNEKSSFKFHNNSFDLFKCISVLFVIPDS